MRRFFPYIASLLSLYLAASAGRAEQGDWDDPSWQILRAAHVHRDGHSLAEYLRGLCGNDADLGRVDQLARQLGGNDFDEREAAEKALTAAGPAALARLRALRGDPDAEVARRAGECVTAIEGKWDPERALAAVRVLVRRGTDEAVPALVRFLPYADSEELRDAVWFGLDALTVRQGKVDASLAAALRDAVPARRAVAACIVGRRGDAGQRGAVRKLLTDDEPEVRLRAAQGLLAAKDPSALPALPALLEETPLETAWQAEELLRYVAGPEAPPTILGAGAAGDRRACREAWEVWWKERGPKVDLAKLDGTNRRPGLMLLCDGGLPEQATGRVWLIGCDGVARWEMRKLSEPTDARLVGGRMLIAQRGIAPPPQKGGSVTAYGFDGKVLWQYRGVDDPTLCQPLPDGNIVVTGRELCMAEVDTTGHETTRSEFAVGKFPNMYHMLPPHTRMMARRLNTTSHTQEWAEVEPGSDYYCKTEVVPWFACYTLNAEGLTAVTDERLVVERGTGRVERFGDEPRRVWNPCSWKLRMPGAAEAVKLPTGLVLACGIGRVVEIDNEGRAVWTASFEEQAQHVRPCLNRVRLGFDVPRPPHDSAADRSAWLHGLSSKDAATRRRTARAIGKLKRWGQEAGPELIPLLKDSDPGVREAARLALAEVYPIITPQAQKAFRDKDPRVRQDAHSASSLIARPLEQVQADALNGSLKDEYFAFFMGLLKDDDPDLRWDGANSLGGDDLHPREAMSALIEATHDSNAKVRAIAANGLGRFGRDGEPAIPTLLRCFKDNDLQVRCYAVAALGEIDPLDERVFPVLIEAVQESADYRFAARALGLCNVRAKEAAPVLLKALTAKDSRMTANQVQGMRSEALFALAHLAPEANIVVPALATLVHDKSVEVELRSGAAHALGEIGPLAQPAIPDLEKAKSDKNLEAAADEAIKKIRID